MHRLLVSAAHKSSGKTTLSIGLVAALSERGHVVQPFKKGPDYIDPMWLARAAGRPCFNLDPYLMNDAAIAAMFARETQGAGLGLYIVRSIVEAHGGQIWAENAPGQFIFNFTLPLTWHGSLPQIPTEV